MKYIITESQNNSLKDSLNNLIDKSGVMAGVKAVGGIDNFIRIMYNNNSSEFVVQVVKDLINNTELRGHHYYLFNCNISVMLNHSYQRPIFDFVPGCYYSITENKYGLTGDIAYDVWNVYSEFIINTYLKNRGY